MKAEQTKREQEIEKLYADMWEDDRTVKAIREEQAAKEQMESNRETLRVSSFINNGILVPVRASFGLRWCGVKVQCINLRLMWICCTP